MKNFFIGVFIAVGALIGLLLPLILAYTLLFSGFRTAGTVMAVFVWPLWIIPYLWVIDSHSQRKA